MSNYYNKELEILDFSLQHYVPEHKLQEEQEQDIEID